MKHIVITLICSGLISLFSCNTQNLGDWEDLEYLQNPTYDLCVNTQDNQLYVLTDGCSSPHQAVVLSSFGEDGWDEVYGTSSFPNPVALAIEKERIYIAEHGGDELTVNMIDTKTGSTLTTPPISLSYKNTYLVLTVSKGTIYVAYEETDPSTDSGPLVIKEFAEETSQWLDLGAQPVSEGVVMSPLLVIEDGIPYVAYCDMQGQVSNEGSHISGPGLIVKKFNGSDWDHVGNSDISEGYAHPRSLFVEGDNVWLAFRDYEYSDYATVKRFDGTEWLTTGNPDSLRSKDGQDMDLIVIKGVPYVGTSFGEVFKFDSGEWIDISAKGFHDFYHDVELEYIDNTLFATFVIEDCAYPIVFKYIQR